MKGEGDDEEVNGNFVYCIKVSIKVTFLCLVCVSWTSLAICSSFLDSFADMIVWREEEAELGRMGSIVVQCYDN